jgi:DNA-directed RNA polymerase specialized sigma24 family protein
MHEWEASAQNDALLLPYLLATEEATSEQLLAQLVTEFAAPLIQQIVGAQLRVHLSSPATTSAQQDAEDACHETMVQLLARLRACKASPRDNPIGNFRGYLAVTTYHVCHRYLRDKYPQRQSLKDKLRYLLTHQSGLALWPNEAGALYGGFAVWRGQPPVGSPTRRWQELRDDPRTVLQQALPDADLQRVPPADLVAAIFNLAGHPVALDELVEVVAVLWGLKEPTAVRSAADDDPFAHLADPRVNIATETEQRLFLQWLWEEIGQLPVRQRLALLLNLRDAEGRGVVELFPLTGIASIRQMAARLEMPLEEFARLWPALPLDDAGIAQLLNLTRQQVINLRKCARERLGRRRRSGEK